MPPAHRRRARLCYPLAIAGTTGVLAVAADGATLYALVSLIGGATQVILGAAKRRERGRFAEDHHRT